MYKKEMTIQLKITDFGKQKIISSREIADRINIIPRFHLQKLNEILFDPERFTPKILGDDSYILNNTAKGTYIQSHRMIAVFDFNTVDELLHILFHEIGHHVYFLIIEQKLKMKWLKDICKNDDFVSEYAKTNAAEDFAESYAAYLLNTEELKGIRLKYHFLHNHVFDENKANKNHKGLNFIA